MNNTELKKYIFTTAVIVIFIASGALEAVFMLLFFGYLPGTTLTIPPFVMFVLIAGLGIVCSYYLFFSKSHKKSSQKIISITNRTQLPRRRYTRLT